MALMRTGDISRSCPVLAERYDFLAFFMHYANTKKSVSAFAEEGGFGIFDHALICHNFLPLLIACNIIKECCCHLTEIATSHLHRPYILKIVELFVFLSLCKAECSDGLFGIIVS